MKTGLPISSNILQSLVLAAFLTFTLTTINSCSEKAIRVSAPSHIRGDFSQLNDTLKGFAKLPATTVMLRSIHDIDSLFLEIKIEDTTTLRSVLTNGLSVWVDPKAGRNETYGMTFIAARSEMLRRREEPIKELEKKEADSAALTMFATRTWVEAVNQREVVVKDVNGSRFADKNLSNITLDDYGNLIYNLKFGFNQLGISPMETDKISIGVISQLHQAQLIGGQQGGISGPPGSLSRPRPQQTTLQPVRLPQVPVNSWIIVNLGTPVKQPGDLPISGEPEN